MASPTFHKIRTPYPIGRDEGTRRPFTQGYQEADDSS